MRKFAQWYMQSGIISLILIALALGIALASLGIMQLNGDSTFAWQATFKSIAINVGILGNFFVATLKAVAPILVFILLINAIASHQGSKDAPIRPVLILYLFGTFSASFAAAAISFAMPTKLTLVQSEITQQAPSNIAEVLHTLFLNIADNPLRALTAPNYIGIITWSVLLGIALRHADEHIKSLLATLSQAFSSIVQWVIRIAPIGIFGLVASTIATTGFAELGNYLRLIVVLLLAMGLTAFVINPLIVFIKIHQNPYPLVMRCLMESGITAFFTRSSAANIPVNMELCRKLNIREGLYSLSIPLGATVNMAGAAITITVITLAVTHTLNIHIDFMSAVLLCSLAAIGACGASGVPGGSLLLIPMACALFKIPDTYAMQAVAVGMIIGVIQDSAETAINSSSDVLYTAAVDISEKRKQKTA